jgi:FkbM family methyltransferase
MNLMSIVQHIWRYPPNRGQRLNRLFRFLSWQIYKRAVGIPLVVNIDNGLRYIAYPGSGGAAFPIYLAEYDFPFVRFHRKWLSGNGTFLDIGTNIGLYTLSLAPHCAAFICVEADLEMVRHLRENLCLNGMEGRAVVVRAAAGERDGTTRFRADESGGLVGRIRDDGDLELPMVRIDSLLKRETVRSFPPIEFIKIDVEGHELSVLTGMSTLLECATPPRMIQFERLKSAPIEPLIAFFNSRGWKVFSLDDTGGLLQNLQSLRYCHDLLATRESPTLFFL